MRVRAMPRTRAKPGSAATFLYRTTSFVARPDALDRLHGAIQGFERHVRCEAHGTRFFCSLQDADDASRFLLVLVFDDDGAERAHRASRAWRELKAVIETAAVAGVREQSWTPGPGL